MSRSTSPTPEQRPGATPASAGATVTRASAGWGAPVTLAVLGLVADLLLGMLVRDSSMDLSVTAAFNTLHTGAIAAVTNTIYLMLEPAGAVALTLVVAAAIAWYRRSLTSGLRFGLAVALAWLPIVALKVIFDRPRPAAEALSHPFSPVQADGSFPSGHTAFVTALALCLILALADTAAARLMRVLGLVMVVGIICVVLINGLHFPTDVLGSLIWIGAMTPLAWQVAHAIPLSGPHTSARRGAREPSSRDRGGRESSTQEEVQA